MAKLPRVKQKIFAGEAPANQVTTFGSIKAGTPVYSKNASDIMNSNFETGWSAAVEDDYAPYRQDRNALDTAMTQQLAYLFQEGIPEWDSTTTYFKGSIVKYNDGNNSKIYKAIYDNTTAALTNTSRWQLVFTIDNSGQMGDVKLSGTPTAPTATAGTSTTQIATTEFVSTALSGKANDSDVVKLTGNQSIAGTKTFTTNIIRTNTSQSAGLSVGHQYTNVTKGIAPTSNVDSRLRLFDKNGTSNTNALGGISFYYKTDGATTSELIAFKPEASSSTNATISITYPASGDPYTSAPTPATSDNSTKIATTAYVQSNLSSYALDSSVVKLTGDQTIAGAKTFTGNLAISKNDPRLYISNTDYTKGTAPSGNEDTYLNFRDSASSVVSQVISRVESSLNSSTRLTTYKQTSGTSAYCMLNNVYRADGTFFLDYYNQSGDTGDSNGSLSLATNSTSSTRIPTMGWVNNPSTSTNVVHRSGDETIGGGKTFTTNVTIKKGSPALQCDNTGITKGTAPSGNANTYALVARDTNGKNVSAFFSQYSTSKNVQTRVYAYKGNTSTDNADVYLRVYYNADGKYGLTLTPDNASGDTNESLTNSTTSTTNTTIPCMGWVNTRLQNVLTRYVNGDSGYIIYDFGGDKYIEQWGHHTYSSTGFETVTLSQAYADNMYSVVGVQSGDASPLNDVKVGYSDNTTTTFKTKVSTSGTGLNWRTFGKAA